MGARLFFEDLKLPIALMNWDCCWDRQPLTRQQSGRARTGLSEQDADKRVAEVTVQVKSDIAKARPAQLVLGPVIERNNPQN